jgi:hypothetical protein
MANQTYHMLHDTEKSKTICGRPIEVNGRPKVLLTASAEKKHGTVCGRCKALFAGGGRAAKGSKIRKAIKVDVVREPENEVIDVGGGIGVEIVPPHAEESPPREPETPKAGKPESQKAEKKGRTPTLAALGEKMPDALEVTYKGTVYFARVLADGRIQLTGGSTDAPFSSPSRAGKAITGREVDGWLFWSYRDADGNLKKLDALRKHDQEGK